MRNNEDLHMISAVVLVNTDLETQDKVYGKH